MRPRGCREVAPRYIRAAAIQWSSRSADAGYFSRFSFETDTQSYFDRHLK